MANLNIFLNGKSIFTECSTIYELRDKHYKNTKDLITIFNGFQTYDDLNIYENDNINFIIKGQMPSKDEFEALMLLTWTSQELMKKAGKKTMFFDINKFM